MRGIGRRKWDEGWGKEMGGKQCTTSLETLSFSWTMEVDEQAAPSVTVFPMGIIFPIGLSAEVGEQAASSASLGAVGKGGVAAATVPVGIVFPIGMSTEVGEQAASSASLGIVAKGVVIGEVGDKDTF